MSRILCLDSEPQTVDALLSHGHQVEVGGIGYRSGKPDLQIPPHEVDLIVCDLRHPACFDRLQWGDTGASNSNYRAMLVPKPTGQLIQVAPGQIVPRYQIIYSSQLPQRPVGHFGADDILKAIAVAGVPAVLFLNPEWISHLGSIGPNFFGAAWTKFHRTSGTALTLTEVGQRLLPEMDHLVRIARPVQFAILEGPFDPLKPTKYGHPTTATLVTNSVNDIFGQAILIGKGPILALPSLENNARFVQLLAIRLDDFKNLDKPRPPDVGPSIVAQAASEVQPVAAPAPSTSRDVFISYAHEDKEEVARPLAQALIALGLTVWFDEFEIRIGDSLRHKIEQGLLVSDYGLTVLSDSFFDKPWPQRELSALFALEKSEPRILPVWHRLTVQDVKRRSPLLADLFAISTQEGIQAVADAVYRKIKDI